MASSAPPMALLARIRALLGNARNIQASAAEGVREVRGPCAGDLSVGFVGEEGVGALVAQDR